jgi:DNA-binding transcriptional LysR family regulator
MAGLKDVSLRQLQILASAARTGSFSRTSEEIHLSQPAVSMQMKALEDLAAQPLFDRVGRRVKLTDAGELLAGYAERVLSLLDEAEDALAARKGLRGGRVRVAAVSTAMYFAPKLLAGFSREHGAVQVSLALENREAVVALLARNHVDLAIMGRPPEELETEAEPFADHPHVVIAPPDHPLASRRRAPLSALAGELFVVREPGSGTRSAMERFFAEREVAVRVGMEMGSNEAIKQAVMAGMGLGFISLHTVGLELAAGRLALVRAEGLPVTRKWHVVRLAEKRLSPAAEAMRRHVVETGARFLREWPHEP